MKKLFTNWKDEIRFLPKELTNQNWGAKFKGDHKGMPSML
jgi:hypothetical protein